MELIEYARKGNIMNIKEKDYIYKFKQLKELTEKQKMIITRRVRLAER
jgi:hypothetical protein